MKRYSLSTKVVLINILAACFTLLIFWFYIINFKIDPIGNIEIVLMSNILVISVFYLINIIIHKMFVKPLILLSNDVSSIDNNIKTGIPFNTSNYEKCTKEIRIISQSIAATLHPIIDTLKNLKLLILESQESQKALKSSLQQTIFTVNDIKENSLNTQSKLAGEINLLQGSSLYFTEVVSSIEEVMVRITNNSNAVEKSINALEKIFTSFDGLNEYISRAMNISSSLYDVASEGEKSVSETKNAMIDIKESSNQVNSYVKVISNISEKTKILSLNASIEAANVGHIGRGFTVVASEIRKLASNSADSITNINDLIKKMSDKINNGAIVAQKASSSIQEIYSRISGDSEAFKEIFTFINSQEEIIMEVAEDLNIIVEITTELSNFNDKQKENINKLVLISESMKKVLPEFQAVLEHSTSNMETVETFLEDVKINIQLNQLVGEELSNILNTFKIINKEQNNNNLVGLIESRKLKRFHKNITFNIYIRGNEKIEASCKTENISYGGISCKLSNPLEKEHIHSLELFLPDTKNIIKPITLSARVSYCNKEENGIEPLYNIGFSFLPFSSEQDRDYVTALHIIKSQKS